MLGQALVDVLEIFGSDLDRQKNRLTQDTSGFAGKRSGISVLRLAI